MKIMRVAFLAFLVFSFIPQGLKAGLVSWQFAGNVTDVYDPFGLLDATVDIGWPLLVDITFDPLTPGQGLFENAITNTKGALGDLGLDGPIGPTNFIIAHDDLPYDTYGMTGGVNLEFVPFNLQLTLFLEDEEGKLLDSETILTNPPPLPETAVFSIWLGDSGDLSIDGTLSSISIIPEPGSVHLILFGSVALVRRKCKDPSG